MGHPGTRRRAQRRAPQAESTRFMDAHYLPQNAPILCQNPSHFFAARTVTEDINRRVRRKKLTRAVVGVGRRTER